MTKTLELFEAFGVELEYMIVDAESLNVRPISDEVLKAAAGEIVSEVDLGLISWSNELALHVIELKTTEPARDLVELPHAFQSQIQRISSILNPLGACLLPTAMHPWMDPVRELKLWPHDYNPVYEAYNRIFDCRGHGWANLQSTHLNLPFSGDEQFGRLHAAIRILLPLLPALAASSPMMDGKLTGFADTRMHVYRDNSRRIPLITGQVVPEAVFSRSAYDDQIFQPMYAAIAPLDPDGILCHEWLNSRGAIARFDRNAIEIRVLDVQETPEADIAICEAIVAVLKLLVGERWTSYAEQQHLPTQMLATVLEATTKEAERAVVDQIQLLKQLGIERTTVSAQELWEELLLQVSAEIPHFVYLEKILNEGPLSRRIRDSLLVADATPASVYRRLVLR